MRQHLVQVKAELPYLVIVSYNNEYMVQVLYCNSVVSGCQYRKELLLHVQTEVLFAITV